MQFFADSVLYSYAQIFFSNRRWFGLMILLATFVVPQLGIMALAGVILSNFAAGILKFDTEKIRSGFYGFNGILFGAAASFYFELTFFLAAITLIFIIITFFISAVLENYLATAFNLPGLSLPFILSLYIFIIFLLNYGTINPGYVTMLYDKTGNEFLPEVVTGYLEAISLIVFQPNIISGIIITAAIFIFSRVLFILSIAAFALNALFIHLILPDMPDSYHILFSFNAILTGFALGGSLIIPSRKSFALVIIASLLVVIMTGFFIKLFSDSYFPVLVLPFNFIVLSTIYSLKFRKENTDIVLLYFKPGSPEENFYTHARRKARFEKFKFLFPELPFFGQWYVSQGFEGEFTHKEDWKYAWDFVVTDDKDKEYSSEGKNPEDYYCFNLPVAAPLDGEIVKVTDGIPDNKIGDMNLKRNWGNTVIIKHEYSLFSALSHLEAGSIKVKEGDKVKKGDIIAKCGSSGRSPVPHLHFQFQPTDKLGDKTYKFPFANFIERKDNGFVLRTFAYPGEKSHVQNVEVHKDIKNAAGFKLGDELQFSCSYKGKEFMESWEVKINMNNELYIESSSGDTAGMYITDKVFYFTNYNGKKVSALYHFFLAAMQIPFCYHENLRWNDTYSIDLLKNNIVRYISEFFLFFGYYIPVNGKFRYVETGNPDEYKISSEIKAEGRSIFSFYNRKLNGEVVISRPGIIKEFNLQTDEQSLFRAVNTAEEERS